MNQKFSREEKAEISSKFRKEITSYGLANAIYSVAASTSEKNVVKREVFRNKCRQKNFAKQFEEACARVVTAHPELKLTLIQLKDEVMK